MILDYSIPVVETGERAEKVVESRMDDQAFARFYESTSRPLWGYLARVSGNAALADDLLQESYLRFLCAKTPWRDDEVLCRRYLFRIATNLIYDHWRRPAHASIEDIPEAHLPVVISGDSDRLDAQSSLSPALARLSPRERQLLWLAYAEGYTHQEIGEITMLAATGIRILLFRARRKLARLLRQRALPEKSL